MPRPLAKIEPNRAPLGAWVQPKKATIVPRRLSNIDPKGKIAVSLLWRVRSPKGQRTPPYGGQSKARGRLDRSEGTKDKKASAVSPVGEKKALSQPPVGGSPLHDRAAFRTRHG